VLMWRRLFYYFIRRRYNIQIPVTSKAIRLLYVDYDLKN